MSRWLISRGPASIETGLRKNSPLLRISSRWSPAPQRCRVDLRWFGSGEKWRREGKGRGGEETTQKWRGDSGNGGCSTRRVEVPVGGNGKVTLEYVSRELSSGFSCWLCCSAGHNAQYLHLSLGYRCRILMSNIDVVLESQLASKSQPHPLPRP